MAGIIPPLIRTQQPNQVPQIDRRGVAANLTAAFVSISGAPLVNAARPSQSLTTAGSPTFTFDSRLGQYIQLNGSSQYLRNTTFTQSGNTYPLTLSAWFYADALAAGNHTIIALTASGGTSVIFQLYTNGANLYTRQYNTSSQIVSATTLVTGKWYLATAVFESLSSRKLYLDGILQGADTVTASAPSGINQIDIGASPWAGPGEYFQGRISALMVLNAALTDKQILALKSNPWQIFAPRETRIFVPVSAGGPTAYTLDSQPGSVAVVGSATTLKHARKLSASPGAVSIVGASATFKATRKLNAAAGSVAISGATAELTYTPVGASPVLNAEPGSITIAGATATLKATRKLAADAGSITISGAAATLVKSTAGLTLNAQPGSVTIAGAAAEYRRTYKLEASSAGITIVGASAQLVYAGATGPTTRAPDGAGPSIIKAGTIRPQQSATSRPSNTGGRRY